VISLFARAALIALMPGAAFAQAPAAQQQAPAARQSAPAAAPSAALEAPLIAVVDIQEIMSRSKAAQAMHPQFEKLKKSYEDEVNKERDALQNEGQQLGTQRAVLAPEAFAQREQALRQRAGALNNLIAERKRTLDQTFANGLGEIRNALFQVTADIARERSINVVLPKESVVLIAKSLEITDEVLKRVDQRLPTLSLKLPTEPKPQGQPRAAQPSQQRPAQQQPSQQKKN
jgi:Skp family chaperone for outer membrane proteins